MHCNIPMPDLPQRLDCTIILYDNKPYLVRTDSDDNLHLYYVHNTIQKFQCIKSSDPKLDIATVPLGYCQYHPAKVVYITRSPSRQFKQGVHSHNIIYQYINGKENFPCDLFTKETEAMMSKEYQSFGQIKEKIKNNRSYSEYAVNNELAVSSDGSRIIKVFFRHEEIGFIPMNDIDNPKPSLIIPKSKKEWVIHSYLKDFNFSFK